MVIDVKLAAGFVLPCRLKLVVTEGLAGRLGVLGRTAAGEARVDVAARVGRATLLCGVVPVPDGLGVDVPVVRRTFGVLAKVLVTERHAFRVAGRAQRERSSGYESTVHWTWLGW